jgi:hypothetical protein
MTKEGRGHREGKGREKQQNPNYQKSASIFTFHFSNHFRPGSSLSANTKSNKNSASKKTLFGQFP